MCFSVEKNTNRKDRIVTPNALVSVNKTIYFSERYTDGLYCFDCDSFETNYVGNLYSNREDKRFLHSTIINEKDKLYFIPYNSDCINIYDIHKSEIEHIELPLERAVNDGNFFCGELVNDKLFLFGYTIPAIYIYDIKSKKLEILSESSTKICNCISNKNAQGLYIHSSVIVKNEIYAVSIYGNFIFQINVLNYDYKIIDLKIDNQGYSGIAEKDGFLWLTPYSSNNFVKYDIKTGMHTLISDDFEYCDWAYVESVFINEYLFAAPCYNKYPILINLNNDQMTTMNNISISIEKEGRENFFISPIVCNTKIVSCIPDRHEVMTYDIVSNEIKLVKLMANRRLDFKENSKIVYESTVFQITDFLEFIHKRGDESRKKSESGYHIYWSILNKIY